MVEYYFTMCVCVCVQVVLSSVRYLTGERESFGAMFRHTFSKVVVC
jgi:hypothetical protein